MNTFDKRLEWFTSKMSKKFYSVRYKHYGHKDVLDMDPGEYIELGNMQARLVREYTEWEESCMLSAEEEMGELIDVANACFLRYYQIHDFIISMKHHKEVIK